MIEKKGISILLILSALLTTAQVDKTFWNNSMIELAESVSVEGWIKIKAGKNFTSDNFFARNKDAFKLSEHDQLVLLNSETDDLGFTHHKYQQMYKGLEVQGCQYILHEENGIIQSANGHLVRSLNKIVRTSVEEATALNIALKYVNGAKNVQGNSEQNVTPKGELLLTFKQNNGNYSNKNYILAYRFEITVVEPVYSKQAIYIDAINGDVFKTEDLICNVSANCHQGTVATLYNGNKNITTEKHNVGPQNAPSYKSSDNCRGGGINTYYADQYNNPYLVTVWGNNNFSFSHRARVTGTAHWAAGITYDFFRYGFGRNSFDGNGAKIELYTNSYYARDNAWWNGLNFHFGDGVFRASNDLVSLDFVGHEFTHAVTDYSADLIYSNESGALNESFSDIFGTMIEFYGQNGSGNYFIGEDFWIQDGKVRDMQNPSSKNHPDTYQGINWWTAAGDNGGVHTNSGVQNHWFYLLAEGGSGTNDLGNNFTVQGIGKTKATRIAYRNLTVYLTSSSNYSDAKNGSILAAMDLFGLCSNEVLQTIRAWDAVGVSSNGGIKYNVIVNCTLLNSIHNQSQAFTAKGIHSLESNCNISANNNAQVTFIAGKLITLNPGFTGNPNFDAYIDPCLSSIQLKRLSSNNITNKEPFKESIVSSKLEDKGNEVTIYPNPVTDFFNVSYTNYLLESAHFTLYDVTGRIVQRKTYSPERVGEQEIIVDASDLVKGTYLYTLKVGVKYYNGKVVK